MGARRSAAGGPTRIAVAVVERDDGFLVGVRPEGAPLAGYWEFPGGKIADGETPAQAAARECLEETGLEVSVGRLLCRTMHDYEHGRLELHFFAAIPRSPQQEPCRPFRWVTRQELRTLRFPPANAEILAILREPKPVPPRIKR
jgi:8-oxo-dGTP diphosphatase